MLNSLLRLARPSHWIKNLVVLLPVIFAVRMDDAGAWAQAALAAAAFCLASSAAYIINDIRDRQKDRLHPCKKDRPLAAGRVSVSVAVLAAAVLGVAAGVVAVSVKAMVLFVILAYLGLQLAYTYFLKRKMLVDVICIALGFVLRAAAGAVAIGVAISPWLFVCMFTICLFMGFCKRCNEIVTAGGGLAARQHRRTLLGYSPELLTHLITVSAGIAVVALLLHATSERTVMNLGTNYLIYTLPLFIYGVFRFAMLSMKGIYSDPTDLILRDRPMQLAVLLWVTALVAVVRWGKALQEWLSACAQG